MNYGPGKRIKDEEAVVQTTAVAKMEKILGNPHWPSILDRTCRATGTKVPEVGEHILAQVGECFVENRTADAADRLFRAVLSLEEMAPTNLTEAMLAGHMLTANSAAQRFLSLSLVEGQPPECVDRLVTRATRLMRVFMEQTELMQRLKGKTGQQRVVVEHVNVHQGGQAIVGAVMGAISEGANAHVQGTPHE